MASDEGQFREGQEEQDAEETFWRALMRQYEAPLRRYFAHVARREEDMRDLIAEVFEAAAVDPEFPRDDESLRWNKLLDYARAAAATYVRLQRHEIHSQVDDVAAAESVSESEALAQLALEDWALERFEELPERQRQAFYYVRVKKMSAAEAGAVMGCNENTVRVHLNRAVKALERLRDQRPPRVWMSSCKCFEPFLFY